MAHQLQLDQFPIQSVRIHGQIQTYREAGQGQTLLLLHGISSGAGSWLKQFQHLSQHYRLIAWDAPGYGQSEPLHTATPSAQDYAERINQLLDVLQLDQVVLVGHSLGAMFAAAFAAAYPERVQHLLLLNPAQGYATADAQTQQQVYAQRPEMLKTLGAAGMAARRGPHLVYQHSPEVMALINTVMANLTLDGFRQASYVLAYDQIQHYLTQLQIPCHVIAGEQDGITPLSGIEALVKQLQLQHFYRIQAAGHLSYLDQPDAFEQIVFNIVKPSHVDNSNSVPAVSVRFECE